MKRRLNCSLFLSMILGLFALTTHAKDSEVTKMELKAKADTKQALPKLLDLGAKKCIPCKKMAPILDELANDYKGVFEVEFIDVWQPENKEKARAHRIRSIPTQIFFDAKGKELWRHEGFLSKEDILKKWKELGFSFKPGQPAPAAEKTSTAESE